MKEQSFQLTRCVALPPILSKSPLLLLICPPHCCYFLVPPTVPTQVGKPIPRSPDGRIVKSLIKLQNVWVVDVIEENANNDCYITPITFLGRLSGAPRQHFLILDPRKIMQHVSWCMWHSLRPKTLIDQKRMEPLWRACCRWIRQGVEWVCREASESNNQWIHCHFQ